MAHRHLIFVPVYNDNPHDRELGYDGTGSRDMISLSRWFVQEYKGRYPVPLLVHGYGHVVQGHASLFCRHLAAQGRPPTTEEVDERLDRAARMVQQARNQFVRDYAVRLDRSGVILFIVEKGYQCEALLRLFGGDPPVRGDFGPGYLARLDRRGASIPEVIDYRPYLLSS